MRNVSGFAYEMWDISTKRSIEGHSNQKERGYRINESRKIQTSLEMTYKEWLIKWIKGNNEYIGHEQARLNDLLTKWMHFQNEQLLVSCLAYVLIYLEPSTKARVTV